MKIFNFLRKKEIRENNKGFHEFIMKKIEDLEKKGVSNCIGTALYLVGEIPNDVCLDEGEYERILDEMTNIDFPLQGSLIGWLDKKDKDLYYMGVVTSEVPFLITNRRGINGKVVFNEPFKKVDKDYSIYSKKREIKYFVPKKLEFQIYEDFFEGKF